MIIGDDRAPVPREHRRELRLEGRSSSAFWPRLAVRTGPFTVANERGFGAEPLLAASNARLSLRLWP
jgi:uncharacterized protein involved in outer membrane biogenesis